MARQQGLIGEIISPELEKAARDLVPDHAGEVVAMGVGFANAIQADLKRWVGTSLCGRFCREDVAVLARAREHLIPVDAIAGKGLSEAEMGHLKVMVVNLVIGAAMKSLL
jgi:hypothetical protein